MRQKRNEGFSLIEVLVAIALLGALVVPTCSGLVMSHRINAKSDALLKAQLAVSSAVETLMAEGINEEQITVDRDYWIQTVMVDKDGKVVDDDDATAYEERTIDRFPDVEMTVETGDHYYNVTVKDNDGLVTVETAVRAAPPISEEEGG